MRWHFAADDEDNGDEDDEEEEEKEDNIGFMAMLSHKRSRSRSS